MIDGASLLGNLQSILHFGLYNLEPYTLQECDRVRLGSARLLNNKEQQNLMSSEAGKQLLNSMLNRGCKDNSNWNKHVNHSCCKCDKCICGKHKCHIKSPQLNLSPSDSTYNQQYTKKRPVSQNCNKNVQYQTYQPRQLVSKTEYKDSYNDKSTNLAKPHLEIRKDNIESGGPSFNATTYQNSYTSAQGSPASKIKNPETLGCTPGARLKTTSSYRDNFKWHLKTKREKPIKHENNLRTDLSMFTAKSSYSTDFQAFPGYKRDRSNFAPRQQVEPKQALKTETSYNDHFRVREAQRCPAQAL